MENVKGFTKEYTKEDFDKAKLTKDGIHNIIEDILKHQTKYWTEEDRELINASMKNIFKLPVHVAVQQAKKWALLEARASTVKIETENERKAWFDKAIEMTELNIDIDLVNKNKEL
jgi:hypothetical protein